MEPVILSEADSEAESVQEARKAKDAAELEKAIQQAAKVLESDLEEELIIRGIDSPRPAENEEVPDAEEASMSAGDSSNKKSKDKREACVLCGKLVLKRNMQRHLFEVEHDEERKARKRATGKDTRGEKKAKQEGSTPTRVEQTDAAEEPAGRYKATRLGPVLAPVARQQHPSLAIKSTQAADLKHSASTLAVATGGAHDPHYSSAVLAVASQKVVDVVRSNFGILPSELKSRVADAVPEVDEPTRRALFQGVLAGFAGAATHLSQALIKADTRRELRAAAGDCVEAWKHPLWDN